MIEQLNELQERLKVIEQRFEGMGYETKRIVQSQLKKSWVIPPQAETMYGLRLGICVDTKDPLGQGRVRFYSPALHARNTPVDALPFAKPISCFGGMDDGGCTWVPPAGSTLALVFENGDRASAYYLGTIWTRDRGAPPHNWNYPMPEYNKYHMGHRGGYLVGAKDESQVLPPWNTESYNIRDFDNITEFENDPNAKKRITIAHIYGQKTQQKHRFKMDDGNYDCNFRWKRMELVSGDGIGILFKDDHLHPAGQWCHPDCGCESSGSLEDCTDEDGNPTESTSCGSSQAQTLCANPLYKRAEECRPYIGPGNPQNNRVTLPQSGLAFWSRSGNIFEMDDSVVEPRDKPGWERTTKPFDYGCKNIYEGKTFWKSAHGNSITLSDREKESGLRSNESGVTIESSLGHKIRMNDHTVAGNISGDECGITIQSSSNNILEMMDSQNAHGSPSRKGGNQPVSKARKGYVRLRTGYGLQVLMRDDNSQENTQSQFIEIMAPQRDNPDRGPHILRMQESAQNAGLVFLRVGGQFIATTTDNWMEQIGTEETKPAYKFTAVKGSYVVDTEDFYFTHSDFAMTFAEKYVVIAAGRECDGDDGPTPCLYPVIVAKSPKVCPFTGWMHFAENSISKRVFCS